jgi:hypothetical protein
LDVFKSVDRPLPRWLTRRAVNKSGNSPEATNNRVKVSDNILIGHLENQARSTTPVFPPALGDAAFAFE